MTVSSLRQPGYPDGQDPWLCVTRLLWLCHFGDTRLYRPCSGRATSEHKAFQPTAEFCVIFYLAENTGDTRCQEGHTRKPGLMTRFWIRCSLLTGFIRTENGKHCHLPNLRPWPTLRSSDLPWN